MRNTTVNKVEDFIKKWGLAIVALVLILPMLLNYLKKMAQNSENIDAGNFVQDVQNQQTINKAENTNTKLQTEKATKITIDTRLHAVAQNIAEFLHVNYSWYDPRYWYEEDYQAYLQFKKIKRSEIPTVARLYNEIFAVGRNLRQDCAQYMNEEYYNKINW